MAGNGVNRGRQGQRTAYRPYYERESMARNSTADRVRVLNNMYQRIMGEMCMGRYTWKGFPESVDKRFLELVLYRNGLVVVFVDERTDKLVAVRAAPAGRYDLNDNPTNFLLYGNSFTGRKINRAQCVPIWGNAMRVPDWDIVSIFAERLAELDRTLEINSKNARRTKIVAVKESQRLTAANINRAIDNGDSAISVNEGVDVRTLIQAIDLGIEGRSIESLSLLRNQEWNRAVGLLGINNANQDKKERLVADEVSANNDQVETTRETNLRERQTAAKKINEMFGAYLTEEVTVDYHSQQVAEIEAPTSGEGDSGDIHY